MKLPKTPSQLLTDAFKNPIAARATENIAKLKSYLQKLEYERRNPEFIAAEQRDGLAKIAEDQAEQRSFRRSELTEGLKNLAGRWEDDYFSELPKNSFKLKTFETRLKALPDSDLQEIAQNYISGEDLDPFAVDSLTAETRSRGLDPIHAAIRRTAKERRYDQPWTHAGPGKEYLQELELLKEISPDIIVADLEQADGTRKTARFEIASLIDDPGGTE